jgi:hypothetical protein
MGVSAESLRRNERPAARAVAQNTAMIGLNPSTMNTTTATSEVKWKPRSLTMRQMPWRGRITSPRTPSLRASRSTIRKSAR